ncbi:Uncharacterised protein [Chlamydia trachomatis]|nr:Uncharacterised protein [Chlamydia trachomatis]
MNSIIALKLLNKAQQSRNGYHNNNNDNCCVAAIIGRLTKHRKQWKYDIVKSRYNCQHEQYSGKGIDKRFYKLMNWAFFAFMRNVIGTVTRTMIDDLALS